MEPQGKRNSGTKADRISVLPKNTIDSILSRLKIKEAVRTSFLSQSWRYQWHSIPKITINYSDLPYSQEARVNFIDHIFLVHRGSVDKFELDLSLVEDNNIAIDRWVSYLSRNGIKELILKNSYGSFYNLPSCLFSCSDLTHLELVKCIRKSLPTSFKGFPSMTELHFHNVKINGKVIEKLVNSCPLLSRLSLSEVDQCPSLKISAPNLMVFHTREVYCYFQFKNTPLLASASFGLESPVSLHIAHRKDCKIAELLGSMPNLQKLEFDKNALQHFAVGDVSKHLPFVCPIKHLTMSINFGHLKELSAAFCIFRNSPFLQTLNLLILVDYEMSSEGFWKGEEDFSFGFDHLEKVDMTDFYGSENELKFIKFVLANAPVLKTMVINFEFYFEDVMDTLDELVQFPRLSPKAEVEVNHD